MQKTIRKPSDGFLPPESLGPPGAVSRHRSILETWENPDFSHGSQGKSQGKILVFHGGFFMILEEEIMEISWKYHGNIMEISWKYHGNIMEISWKYHGNIMDISWTYHGNIMEISWKYHGHIMDIDIAMI